MQGNQAATTETGGEQQTRTVSVFKAAVFKVHNPSKHKRAMLRTAMKRAQVCYGRLTFMNGVC